MSKFNAPRGTQDIFDESMKKWQKIETIARHVCELYHVSEMKTPIFEHTEVFNRHNDASDMVNKEMYTFEDRGNRSLTLKPEGTAGIIRSFVEHKLYAQGNHLHRYFYISPNFRYERPQKGRMRIHHQFGVEFIGPASPYIDLEAIQLGLTVIHNLGLRNYKLMINTLGDQQSQDAYRVALKDHFQPHLPTLCADCNRRYQQNPLRILDCKVDKDHDAIKHAPSNADYLTPESQAYFKELVRLLDVAQLDYVIDHQLVRGLDYYHHTVFEVVSTHKESGAQSTIFAGGRYDQLVRYYGGPDLSAIGFGMGIERLLVFAETEGIDFDVLDRLDVFGMPLDRKATDAVYSAIQKVRQHGYTADMDFENRSLKAQFKMAERFNAEYVLLCGSNELETGTFMLKNTTTQQQESVSQDSIIDWLTKQSGERQ